MSYIKVKVFAGAKKEYIKENPPAGGRGHFDPIRDRTRTRASAISNGVEVAVKEKAERNLANRRVIELVAKHLKVPAGKIRIISGHHSPSKMLSIDLDD